MSTAPHSLAPSPAEPGAAIERFFGLLQASLAAQRFVRLVLSKRSGRNTDATGPIEDAPADRITVRPIQLRNTLQLQFVHRHASRDITRNEPIEHALATLRRQIGPTFQHAHLASLDADVELRIGKRGTAHVHVQPRRGEAAAAADTATEPAAHAIPLAHDRAKHRVIALDRPYLVDLGITDSAHRLVPAMARKWKQINKFVEVVDHALAGLKLPGDRPLRVVDFGCGKGYLTFALHDHLQSALGLDVDVVGVELRGDLVQLCNAAVARSQLHGLRFEQGDVRTQAPAAIDVMIALHACDTATDHAMHAGVQAGAQLIVCSPCCHKQIRPQLRSPPLLLPMLQHGIHLGQQAEMVTDALRALLLEAEGYATQVFEFVALEHTSKNKMILASQRALPARRDAVQRQIAELKAFYGVQEHCLESLLKT